MIYENTIQKKNMVGGFIGFGVVESLVLGHIYRNSEPILELINTYITETGIQDNNIVLDLRSHLNNILDLAHNAQLEELIDRHHISRTPVVVVDDDALTPIEVVQQFFTNFSNNVDFTFDEGLSGASEEVVIMLLVAAFAGLGISIFKSMQPAPPLPPPPPSLPPPPSPPQNDELTIKKITQMMAKIKTVQGKYEIKFDENTMTMKELQKYKQLFELFIKHVTRFIKIITKLKSSIDVTNTDNNKFAETAIQTLTAMLEAAKTKFRQIKAIIYTKNSKIYITLQEIFDKITPILDTKITEAKAKEQAAKEIAEATEAAEAAETIDTLSTKPPKNALYALAKSMQPVLVDRIKTYLREIDRINNSYSDEDDSIQFNELENTFNISNQFIKTYLPELFYVIDLISIENIIYQEGFNEEKNKLLDEVLFYELKRIDTHLSELYANTQTQTQTQIGGADGDQPIEEEDDSITYEAMSITYNNDENNYVVTFPDFLFDALNSITHKINEKYDNIVHIKLDKDSNREVLTKLKHIKLKDESEKANRQSKELREKLEKFKAEEAEAAAEEAEAPATAAPVAEPVAAQAAPAPAAEPVAPAALVPVEALITNKTRRLYDAKKFMTDADNSVRAYTEALVAYEIKYRNHGTNFFARYKEKENEPVQPLEVSDAQGFFAKQYAKILADEKEDLAAEAAAAAPATPTPLAVAAPTPVAAAAAQLTKYKKLIAALDNHKPILLSIGNFGQTINENYNTTTLVCIKRVQILVDTLRKFQSNRTTFYNYAKKNMLDWCKNVLPRDLSGLEVIVEEEDWGEAAQKYTKKYQTIFACLNMANSSKPGGGYEHGMAAQEENMFRRTDCHFFIDRNKLVSDKKIHPTYRYNQTMEKLIDARDSYKTYLGDSPRICIKGPETLVGTSITNINDDIGYRDLSNNEMFLFYELRCAAKYIVDGAPFKTKEMDRRIHAQFATLKKANIRHAILSAFGCGAFHNKPEDVAKLYKKYLVIYKNDFDVVVFAIHFAGNGPENYDKFRKVLLPNTPASSIITTFIP